MSRDIYIPTYVINLRDRPDRLAHIKNVFHGRNEFEVNIFPAIKDKIGAVGLWKSIVDIVRIAKVNNDDVIIICEDDHTFTESYKWEILFEKIIDASDRDLHLLIGGIGGYGEAVSAPHDNFFLTWFYSTQFLVVFNSFFDQIINASFQDSDVADGKLSVLTNRREVIFPFISFQTDFGYSDVTSSNETIFEGKVSTLFSRAERNLRKKKDQIKNYCCSSFKIVILLNGVDSYIQECYTSVFYQFYDNFGVYFLDNLHTINHHSSSSRKERRHTTMQGEIKALDDSTIDQEFREDDIIVIINSNDILFNNYVLRQINEFYNKTGCLMSYGQFIDGEKGLANCNKYNLSDFEGASLNGVNNVFHLKTFKFKLLKQFLEKKRHGTQLSCNKIDFLREENESLLMKVLFETAGYNMIYFNPWPIYYRRFASNHVDFESKIPLNF